jgi:hypothetical protein
MSYTKTRFITYELMVKNDSSFLERCPNNYRGALQEDDPPTYIWPRVGSSTDDTSRFDLHLQERNVSSIEIVAFQILTNSTTDTVLPEYITLEDPSLRTPHTVVGSSGAVLENVWASLRNANFQKTYGRMSMPVYIGKETLLRKLHIRLYDVDRTAFSLGDQLPYAPGSPKAFHALLTVRLEYHQ